MQENHRTEKKKAKKPYKKDMKIKSLDIDKAEYREIVLSHSNFPDSINFRDYR